jgi:integrase
VAGRSHRLDPEATERGQVVLTGGVREGYLDLNPAQGITHARGNGTNHGGEETGRLPYDSGDLKLICDALKNENGARRFLPFIAMYSGCRIEEIAGLRVADVKQEEDVWYFDVVPHAERRLKSRSSRRQVPVHPELVRAGLLEYVRKVPPMGGCSWS